MTQYEAVEVWAAVERDIGKYTSGQYQRIAYLIEQLTKSDVEKIKGWFLDNLQRKPSIAEWKRALLNAKKKKETGKVQELRPEHWFPKCRFCGDTGILWALDKRSKESVNFRCSECFKNPEDNPHRTLPKWNKSFEKDFELEKHTPWNREYQNIFNKILKTPGGALELSKRARNGLTYTSEDFDFIVDENYVSKQQDGLKTVQELLTIMQGM